MSNEQGARVMGMPAAVDKAVFCITLQVKEMAHDSFS